ncbi:MAG: TPM domain-containing protein [Sediminicola sp.]
MSKVEAFLTEEEEADVIKAIVAAEKNTSGEIRVHIEGHTDGDPYDRAKDLFHQLKMDNTKDGNGVLIYVAVQDRKFVICGDRGINDIVGTNFWNSTKDAIQEHFKKGNFKQGLINGILMAGEALQQYFPWDHNDTNELSNEISKE